MDRPKGTLVCTGTTWFSSLNTRKFCSCTSKTIGSTIQMKQLCNCYKEDHGKAGEKKKNQKTSWGFGIFTISDGWIHFASFPMQSDIQIKLEHHLVATIQRQQGLETRNHDESRFCLPDPVWDLGERLYLEQGKEVSSKCKPMSNWISIGCVERIYLQGKRFYKKILQM